MQQNKIIGAKTKVDFSGARQNVDPVCGSALLTN